MKQIDRVKEYIKEIKATQLNKDVVAVDLGVNERTVREAISQLCDEGITWYPLREKGYGGWYLKVIDKSFDYLKIEEELQALLRGMSKTYFRRAMKYKALLKNHAKELKFPKILEQAEQLQIIFQEVEDGKGN